MTLTVRLDPDLEREFNVLCGLKHAIKSSIVSDLVRGTALASSNPGQSLINALCFQPLRQI